MTYRDVPPVSTSKNRFSEVMARCGDAELISIVEGPADDWQPEALAAASIEVQRRALPFEIVETIVRTRGEVDAKERSRLARGGKALAFFGGMVGYLPGVVAIYFYSRFQRNGQKRKARDVIEWFFFGLAAHFLVLFFATLRR